MARHLLDADGFFVGASSAMHCCAAVEAARRLGPGHTIVTVLCDGGHRYLGSLHAPQVQAASAVDANGSGQKCESESENTASRSQSGKESGARKGAPGHAT